MVSATLLSFFLVPLYFLVVCSIFQRRSTPPAEAKATPPTTH
jgi:hypothetical protein